MALALQLERRQLTLAVRLQVVAACSISLLALSAICAGAQTGGSQQLPPVSVTPPAPNAPAKKAAPSQAPGSPAAAPSPQTSSNPATALGSFNPALDLQGVQLPPGTTLTTAGAVDGYRALTSVSATRTATPIEQIPQSIQVVPRSVIDDQGAQNIQDATRNVSGVQATNPLLTPTFSDTKIRGFGAEQWVDGIMVYYNAGNRDAMANIERIEVLKGPSAILYGGGSGVPVGGAINIVSKLPTDKSGGEIGFTFGSHGLLKPYVDINQPLNDSKTVLFRLTGEYTSADSFIDVLESENYAINPTLTLTNKTDTTITVQGHFNRWKQQEYQGLPATGTVAGTFRIDPDLFIGPSDIPKSYSESQGVTVTFDHRMNENADIGLKARWSRSRFAEYVQTISGPGPFGFTANEPAGGIGSTWFLSNAYLFQEVDEVTINPHARFKFDTDLTKNVVVFGADYSRVADKGILTADVGGAGTVDLLNPSFPVPYAQPADSFFTTFQKPDNVYETRGLYGQVQSTVFNRLHLLAGVRLANVEIQYQDPTPFVLADVETSATKVLPRLGAVFDVLPGLSVYASYSEGLRANPFTRYVGAPKPEEATQKEAGVKIKLSSALSGTLAVFDIERANVPVAAPGGLGSLPIGEQRSRGFETDWIWQPNRNWQLIASYAFIDAELLKEAAGAPAGSKLIGIPDHSGRVWVNYLFDPHVLKGWSVGAGIYAAAGSPVDLANQYFTGNFFTVDAKLGYEDDRIKAAFHVKNLTGEQYFLPYGYFGGRVATGDDRAFFGTLAYKY